MRHAKSDWQSHTADIDRPLNDRGRQDAINMGNYLKQNDLMPDKMIVSTAQRTQETASLLLNNLSVADENIIVDNELYLADRETLCDIIELYAVGGQKLLILAHNPGMDYLVSYLARESPTLSSSGKLMTTCAVAYFHLDSVDALNKQGCGELKKLIRPKEIFDIS
jgi:phosphohistidine phosphatase